MTRTTPRPLGMAAAGAAALAVLCVGCGESRNYGGTTSPSPPPPTARSSSPATTGTVRPSVTVTEREFSISPQNVHVAHPGSTVIAVRNRGTVRHALEVEGPTGDVRTAAIAPGGSARLNVALGKSGHYTWYCPIDGHRARGMSGHLVVRGGPRGGGGGSSSGGGGSSGGGSSGGGGYNSPG